MRRLADPAPEAARLLGGAVTLAIPIQRVRPDMILALSIVELAAVIGLAVTTNLAAFAVLVVVAAALVIVGASNRHGVLAVTPDGVVLVGASARGRPRTVLGRVDVTWPDPRGLSAAIGVGTATWWADRAAFDRIRAATGGESPESSS